MFISFSLKGPYHLFHLKRYALPSALGKAKSHFGITFKMHEHVASPVVHQKQVLPSGSTTHNLI